MTHDRPAAHREPGLWRVPQIPWPADLPIHGYRAFLDDADTTRRALRQLAACFCPPGRRAGGRRRDRDGDQAFGCIRETKYGRIFDVRTRHGAANLADTALALAPRTDNPYRLSPPEVQVLHCLSAAGRGGQSRLVNGRAVVTALRAEAPVIAPDRIRYNPRVFQDVVTEDADGRAAWLAAFARFGERLAAPGFGVAFDMAPGDMVTMDNRRVLHGRTAFDASGDMVRRRRAAAQAPSDPPGAGRLIPRRRRARHTRSPD